LIATVNTTVVLTTMEYQQSIGQLYFYILIKKLTQNHHLDRFAFRKLKMRFEGHLCRMQNRDKIEKVLSMKLQ